jgi:small subunit ribosomal protein S8
MIDPIADMLTRIRNASLVKKEEVVLPMSKVKFNIAKILEKEGFVSSVSIISGGEDLKKNKAFKFDQIKIVLKYGEDGKSKVTLLKRISKPGRRIYVDRNSIGKVLNGFGISIISTSKGIMTGKEAQRQKIGGELICEIY